MDTYFKKPQRAVSGIRTVIHVFWAVPTNWIVGGGHILKEATASGEWKPLVSMHFELSLVGLWVNRWLLKSLSSNQGSTGTSDFCADSLELFVWHLPYSLWRLICIPNSGCRTNDMKMKWQSKTSNGHALDSEDIAVQAQNKLKQILHCCHQSGNVSANTFSLYRSSLLRNQHNSIIHL